jgi:sodium-dependent dicarboxylate transporter 2/3/5
MDPERATGDTAGRRRLRRAGLFAGPTLAALTWAIVPDTASNSAGDVVAIGQGARATAAVAIWMATWWLSEAIPIYATALLPLALLPLLGAASMRATAAPYAHELIFLFLGGFLIANAMERWSLHRRIALSVLRFAGERPANVVAGFMGVTALLSMWVSNSATAIMMLPVALSVIDTVESQMPEGTPSRNFGIAMLLGIAYGASIGGIATPIGTPPNLFLLSFIAESLGREISFVRWMGVGLPLVAVFLPIAWWLLTQRLYPLEEGRIEGGRALIESERRRLGPMSRGERIVLAVFGAAALLWVTRPLLPVAGLTDAGIAMLAATVLFVTPVDWRTGEFALDWETAARTPWGVLLLFGGGLSLAAAIRVNGVGELLGGQVGVFAGAPSLVVVLFVVTTIVFLTELTSNTATTATFIPILAALAPGLGLEPLLLIVPAAIAASCAFMLPVATPPNAVIFGSGRVGIPEMSRAGFWLNWIGVVLVTALAYAVALPLLR